MDFRRFGWLPGRLHPDDQAAEHKVAVGIARSWRARAHAPITDEQRAKVLHILDLGRKANDAERAAALARGEPVGLLDEAELLVQSEGGDRDMASINRRALQAERWNNVRAFLVRFMKWGRG